MVRMALVSLLSLSVSAQALAAQKSAVAVLDIQGTGVDPTLLPTLTEVLTVDINNLGKFRVIAGRDIQSMLGFERQKDVMGCTDSACLAEIGGALGVDRIVASHIGKVGSTYVVNIKLINIRDASTEGRVYETVRGQVDALIGTIRRSVTKLFGAPAPAAATVASQPAPGSTGSTASPTTTAAPPENAKPKPTHVAARSQPAPSVEAHATGGGIGAWPIVLWSVGGVALAGGVVAGLMAQDDAANANDKTFIGGQLAAQKAPGEALASTILYVAGGVVAASGFAVWLFSGSSAKHSAPKTAFAPVVTPHGAGFAVAGHF